jgi:hypothetical protein
MARCREDLVNYDPHALLQMMVQSVRISAPLRQAGRDTVAGRGGHPVESTISAMNDVA